MASVQSKQRVAANLKPIARAYVLAYFSSTGPKLLSLLISVSRRRRAFQDTVADLRRIALQALRLNSFATFCSVLVGVSISLQTPVHNAILLLLQKFQQKGLIFPSQHSEISARFVASLVGATISFSLVNRSSSGHGTTQASGSNSDDAVLLQNIPKRTNKIPSGLPPLPIEAMKSPPKTASSMPLAGRSIDLTLFAVVRAMDILIQSSGTLTLAATSSRLKRFLSNSATAVLFVASSATIMHAFFYSPYRLPYTYVAWIDRIANCDERLIRALREARYGNLIYGKDTGLAPLLGSMCKDYGLPEELGDPAKTIPVPCEIVHQGCGPSCEYHALSRFWSATKSALRVYAPLQALILLRMIKKQSMDPLSALAKVVVDAARSSAFLGAFVSLFYYGVCLARTRLGPKLFSYKTITPQMWDGGLCIVGGCMLCGWSVLFEIARRRLELTLFVVPRALGVLFPRKYDLQHRWREHLAFAASAAVIMTAAQEKPERIRGVFGKVVRKVMAP